MKYEVHKLNRRQFIKLSAYLGSGLTLGISEGIHADSSVASLSSPKKFQPNIWLSIEENNRLNLTISKVEMGQGISTALAMLIADELDADWAQVNIIQVDASVIYGNMTTAGSTSIRSLWMPLRKAGAAAREMLIQAAASRWRVPINECSADSGFVIHTATQRSLVYGELTHYASKLDVPENPSLKNAGSYKLIGRPLKRLDALEKVTGQAVYGIDIEFPGLKYAAIRQAPVFGARVESYDATAVAARSGVLSVISLGDALVVVAETYWQAQQAVDEVEIHWAGVSSLSGKKIQEDYRLLSEKEGVLEFESGERLHKNFAQKIEADYEVALQAHACMEPMNCTARVTENKCEVWAPTQNPLRAQKLAGDIVETSTQKIINKIKNKLGLHEESIHLHIPLLGGGFGRRLEQDYVIQAVQISKLSGFPIKLIWSRQEDIQHDFYRPYTYHKLKADLSSEGAIDSWQHRIIGPTRGRSVGGAASLPYDISYKKIDYHLKKYSVPVGSWRSVGSSHNAFVKESFVDELAFAANIDPYEYRRKLLKHQKRVLSVLDKVADMSGWAVHQKKKSSFGLGMALHVGFGSIIAQVARLSMDASTGEIKMHEIYCVIDAGRVVNPGIVRAQVEGGIAFALTATLKGEITIEGGRVQQGNLHDFPLLAMNEMPEVLTYIMPSQRKPGGVGEVSVPPVAAAVCNAIFNLRKIRVRRIPVNLGVLSSS